MGVDLNMRGADMEDLGKISVIMGVFNCEKTLTEAICSIRDQTYKNWELIICDDGSSDQTLKLAEAEQKRDARIIVIKNTENCGLNRTLNNCLSIATGKYIARMDGDDLCHNDRLEKEITFLHENPDYAIVSTPMELFDEKGIWGETTAIPEPSPEDVVCGSPICHAPVMMTRECIDKVKGYTENKWMLRVEDVNLWIKLYAAGYKCYNLQHPLYQMRNDINALNRRKYKFRINSTYVRLQGCRMLHLGLKCYIKSLSPLVRGLVPSKLRHTIRKKQYSKQRTL